MSTSKMIQVRNVPSRVHRELVREAQKRGQTLTQYIEEILEREVAQRRKGAVFERIMKRSPVHLEGVDTAELIRQERENRDEHLERVTREKLAR